jgi:hypothetical protein
MTAMTSPALTADEIARYRRDGWVAPARPVFKPERFKALIDYFDRALAALPPGERPENMDVPHFADPALFAWLFDDDVLDLVEPLLGPDLALFSSHFICKPPGDGKRVPWHEDSAYWNGMMTPMEAVTVWVAIDRSDASNGAMRVIPGTHSGGYSQYEPVDPAVNVFRNEIRKELFDAKRAVTIELEPNQCSLHDARLMHGSDRNVSDRRRCGFTMRYVSTATRYHHEKYPYHQLYLARGKDRAGNRYGDPTKPARELITARIGQAHSGH